MFSLADIMLMYALFFAIVGNAFQPYYHHRRRHHYRFGNILYQQDYNRRRLVQHFYAYASTDPSIIEHNRQYFYDKLGFSKEKLDNMEAKEVYRVNGSVLTLKIGILDERVS